MSSQMKTMKKCLLPSDVQNLQGSAAFQTYWNLTLREARDGEGGPRADSQDSGDGHLSVGARTQLFSRA